jgi:hypothetical protein
VDDVGDLQRLRLHGQAGFLVQLAYGGLGRMYNAPLDFDGLLAELEQAESQA